MPSIFCAINFDNARLQIIGSCNRFSAFQRQDASTRSMAPVPQHYSLWRPWLLYLPYYIIIACAVFYSTAMCVHDIMPWPLPRHHFARFPAHSCYVHQFTFRYRSKYKTKKGFVRSFFFIQLVVWKSPGRESKLSEHAIKQLRYTPWAWWFMRQWNNN